MIAVANNLETNCVVKQMLTHEEERLVDLFVRAIVKATLNELYEKKRDTLSKVQQQGTE